MNVLNTECFKWNRNDNFVTSSPIECIKRTVVTFQESSLYQ